MKSLAIIYTMAIVTGVGAYTFITSGLSLQDPKPYGYELQVKDRTGSPAMDFQVQGGLDSTLQVTTSPEASESVIQGDEEDTDGLQPTLTGHNL